MMLWWFQMERQVATTGPISAKAKINSRWSPDSLLLNLYVLRLDPQRVITIPSGTEDRNVAQECSAFKIAESTQQIVRRGIESEQRAFTGLHYDGSAFRLIWGVARVTLRTKS